MVINNSDPYLMSLTRLLNEYVILNKKFLTIEDASTYLDIPFTEMEKFIEKGKLPLYKPTRNKVFVKREDLDDLMLNSLVIDPKKSLKAKKIAKRKRVAGKS